MTRVDSPVPLMPHDPDKSWITDPNSDHPKGTHPQIIRTILTKIVIGLFSALYLSENKAPLRPLSFTCLKNKVCFEKIRPSESGNHWILYHKTNKKASIVLRFVVKHLGSGSYSTQG